MLWDLYICFETLLFLFVYCHPVDTTGKCNTTFEITHY